MDSTRYFERSIQRFNSYMDRRGPGECWPWRRSRQASGHGYFRLFGRVEKAHRAAWMLLVGPISDGAWVLHKCDNPPCVNPAHLYLGTPIENVRDMVDRGRAKFGERGTLARKKIELPVALEMRRGGADYTAIARRFGV